MLHVTGFCGNGYVYIYISHTFKFATVKVHKIVIHLAHNNYVHNFSTVNSMDIVIFAHPLGLSQFSLSLN